MKIALLGDIALFGCYSLGTNKTMQDKICIIADYLKGFDLVVGNLETPFSKEKRHYGAKSAYICSETQNIDVLKMLHLDAVCLANNHMFDFGTEGYETTKRLLEEAGINWFGTEGKDYKIEFDGNKIVFSGYCCYSTNPLKCVTTGDYGVNAYNLALVRERLIANNLKGCLNIIAVHAGIEHINYPSSDHIFAARKLAEAGSYVYYGHHPHVIQGVEQIDGALIAHSLGNFCFDDVYTSTSSSKPLVELTENNRNGLILELEVDCNKIISWREQPIYIGKDGEIKLCNEEDKLIEYNRTLSHCQNNIEDYNKRRSAIIGSRLAERKAQRNIYWFLKRLQPRYFRLILDMKRNAKLYNENVRKYL